MYNNVPNVPGIDPNASPGRNVADWLSRLGPGDLNQFGDLEILNASIDTSGASGSQCARSLNSPAPSSNPPPSPGNVPLNYSGGSGISNVNAPSFNSSSSSSGSSGGGGAAGPLVPVAAGAGALAQPTSGPGAPGDVHVFGVLRVHGVVPRNLDLSGGIAGIAAGGSLQLQMPPQRAIDVGANDLNNSGVFITSYYSEEGSERGAPQSPASVPSPRNNFTPPGSPPRPMPPSPASIPSPGNNFTPPGSPPRPMPPSPASIPSPGNNFTPPGSPPPPPTPASVPSPRYNTPPGLPVSLMPQLQRPQVLLGENLNLSNVSNGSGGLEGFGMPNLNETPPMQLIGDRDNALNMSGNSGLSGMTAPSLNSSGSGGRDISPFHFRPRQLDFDHLVDEETLNISGNSGLSGMGAPSLCSTGSGRSVPAAANYAQNRTYNLDQFQGQGLLAEGEPSFGSWSSGSDGRQSPQQYTPASVPSPGNNYTPGGSPPACSPASVPSPGNNYTPYGSPAPLNLRRPEDVYKTPARSQSRRECERSLPSSQNSNGYAGQQQANVSQRQNTPASVPSPGNNFTPPASPPASPQAPPTPASVPSPGTGTPPGLPAHLMPQRPEDLYRTPPRPEVLLGENLNLSNVSNGSGGLEGMAAPNLDETPPMQLIGEREDALNASASSGLSGVGEPSFCSSKSGTSAPPSQRLVASGQNSVIGEREDALNISGSSLAGVDQPSFASSASGTNAVTSPSQQAPCDQNEGAASRSQNPVIGEREDALNISGSSGLGGVDQPSFTSSGDGQDNGPSDSGEREQILAGSPRPPTVPAAAAPQPTQSPASVHFTPPGSPAPPTPASVPSPGNNFTPPAPRTPPPVSSPANNINATTPPRPRREDVFCTPPKRAPPPRQAQACGRGNAAQRSPYGPPQPTPPASVPRQENYYTPPGLPAYLMPQRPEDLYRTPPRPEILLGENLNLSNVSNGSGGLQGMGMPNLNNTNPSVNTPSLNASNRSGLSDISQPSFSSNSPDPRMNGRLVASTPYAQGRGSPPDMIQFSPPDMIQFSPIQNQPFGSPNNQRVGPAQDLGALGIRRLENVNHNHLMPGLGCPFAPISPPGSPIANVNAPGPLPVIGDRDIGLNVSANSGLSGMGAPSFNSSGSSGPDQRRDPILAGSPRPPSVQIPGPFNQGQPIASTSGGGAAGPSNIVALPGPSFTSPDNRVFNSNRLRAWVMEMMLNACQGTGRLENECQEHTLKFLMGLVTNWRNLYSTGRDGRFNFLNSNHIFNNNK